MEGNSWCFFILRRIPAKLLRRLIRDAEKEERSLSDFIRSVLCDYYELDCPPSESPSRLEFGARTQLLRLQPELFTAIKEEAAETGLHMRTCVLQALETRYVTPEEAIPA